MTVDDIIEAFVFAKEGKMPVNAIRAAVEQKEALTPHLLDALDDSIQDYEDGCLDCGGWLMPNFAAYLLAGFGEKAAHERIVKLFSMDEDSLEWLWSDAITEDGATLMLSTYGGDPGPLQTLVENEEADPYARAEALQALHGAAVLSPPNEPAFDGYLTSLFRGKIQREPSFLWCAMVNLAADRQLRLLEQDILRAYEEELCDDSFFPHNDILTLMRGGKPWPDYQPEVAVPVADVEKLISKWGYFLDRSAPTKTKLKMKVGRNDPCPCGSGKKHKKCCGAAA